MIPVSKRKHYKRLEEKEIVICEKFGYEKDKCCYIVSDGSRVDDVRNLPKYEVIYFKDGKKIYKIKRFDKKLLYTFVSNSNSNKKIVCTNCGNSGKEYEFVNGCPSCGSVFNMDYIHKKSTGFRVTEFSELKDKKAIVVILTIIMFLIMNLFAWNANEPIIQHIFIFVSYFFILVFMVFGYLYTLIKNSMTVSVITQMLRNKILTSEQELYNDLNTELSNYYYDEKNEQYEDIIDFDILKYNKISFSLDSNNTPYILLSYKIRKVYLKNNKAYSKISKSKVRLKKNNVKEVLIEGCGVIKCINCGAPIDISSTECEYCHEPNIFKTEWTIDKFIKEN